MNQEPPDLPWVLLLGLNLLINFFFPKIYFLDFWSDLSVECLCPLLTNFPYLPPLWILLESLFLNFFIFFVLFLAISSSRLSKFESFLANFFFLSSNTSGASRAIWFEVNFCLLCLSVSSSSVRIDVPGFENFFFLSSICYLVSFG